MALAAGIRPCLLKKGTRGCGRRERIARCLGCGATHGTQLLSFQWLRLPVHARALSLACVRALFSENDTFQAVERMAAPRHPLRDRLLTRIRLGELASVREIMLVASIPRQTANRWLREAGIDLKVVRLRRIAEMHEQEELYLAARSGMKRPTAAQRRRDTLKAVRRFNAANGKAGEPGSA